MKHGADEYFWHCQVFKVNPARLIRQLARQGIQNRVPNSSVEPGSPNSGELEGFANRASCQPAGRIIQTKKYLCQNRRRNQRKWQPLKSLRSPRRLTTRQRPQRRSFPATLGDVETGTYKRRRVDFNEYAASCFRPYLFSGYAQRRQGCGASALALLTGVLPDSIALRNGQRHFSDRFMLKILREHGFTVLPLTLCNLSDRVLPVTHNHVILLSQLFKINEATWGVIHDGAYFHNFDIFSLDQLSFINKPNLTAYVVIHRTWQLARNDEMAVEPSPFKPPRLDVPGLRVTTAEGVVTVGPWWPDRRYGKRLIR